MRQLLLLLLLVTSILGSGAPSAHALDDSLTIANTLLQAEYDLARKKQIYLYLNLEQKQFEIRSSGMTVTTIAIMEVRPWGTLPEAGLHLIADKDRVPEREKIKIPPPGGEEVATKPTAPAAPVDPAAPPVVKKFEVQATEVTDMPTSYSLWLEGGGLLSIRSFPEETGWREKIAQRFEKPRWKISRALQSVLHHYKDESFTELTLILTPLDAQRLYWALPVGSALLIPAAQL